MPIIIEDFTFTYRGNIKPALRNIKGKIADGNFVVLMGHAGAGKSTLCLALNGLIPKFFPGQYQGRVLVNNQEVAQKKVAEMARLVGLVFQDFEAQLFSTNVELEMAFGLENQALPRGEIAERIRRYLSFVGLTNLSDREPASLSGGQKQRLAIGSILALEPNVLVMDEPMTDLDPQGREEILSLVEKIKREGRMLLIVDYEPETALMADQVWLLQDGILVAQGQPEEILVNSNKLKSCGLRPLATVELFQKMSWPHKPLSVSSAMKLIEKYNLCPRRKFAAQPLIRKIPGQSFLEAEGLEFTYPLLGIKALRGIDLSIQEGEFIALLGQNGSGKTTLAKHINGLLRPTAGEIKIKGKPLRAYSRREMASLVGYVFQNPDHQIFANTVKEEVGFGLRMMREESKKIEQRVEEALGIVGLPGYEEKNPFTLTKGERQRVAVASILAAQPQMIILDEPTTGLDYLQQRSMMEMLKILHKKGHTILIITHSMWVAAEYAQRIILMKDGRVLADGPTREVFFNEGLLAEAALRPPALVQLSNWLGTRALSVEEMVEELKENNFLIKG
ncbi:MAG: ABC transporter ATP-binding protein [Thermodesulfobacteriota bacterium]